MLRRAGGDLGITNVLGLTPLSYACVFRLSISPEPGDPWEDRQVHYRYGVLSTVMFSVGFRDNLSAATYYSETCFFLGGGLQMPEGTAAG